MPLSRVQAHLGDSNRGFTYGSSLDEARRFYQARIALFGRVALFFILSFWLASNLVSWLSGEQELVDFVRSGGSISAFVSAGAACLIWWICRTGERPMALLRVLDAGFIFSYCCVLSVWVWTQRNDSEAVFASHLPVSYALIARAVIVPDTSRRTAVISSIGWLPHASVVVAISILGSEGDVALPDPGMFVVRGLLGVALATTVSQVIYGLRRQVRKAAQLGQYRLEEKIGEGAMGEVYRASHALLRRPTAIKLLRKDSVSEYALARFEREVQLTSRLTHPNTIAIFDFGRTPEGIFYYAMELLDGLDLDTLVKRYGPQDPRRVVHVLRQICGSLGEAHAHGLIHRDVKPANVVLCERGNRFDVAKLVDFGLVKDLDPSDGETTLSAVGTVLGTPLFMSPEAIRDPVSVDGRSDLYSVGAVGYYLLTGQYLFESRNVMEVCTLQLSSDPARPSQRLGRVLPEDLESVILRCLKKAPEDRPPTAYDLCRELESCKDCFGWTDEDARSWWAERPEARSSKAEVSAKRDSESSGRRAKIETPAVVSPTAATLDVDLERR